MKHLEVAKLTAIGPSYNSSTDVPVAVDRRNCVKKILKGMSQHLYYYS
jgi:hypothetical protein